MAKFNGVPLNDALLKGPDLLTSLVAVLNRFCRFLVAVSADIVQMFFKYIFQKEIALG